MCKRNMLTIIAVAILALAIGQAQANLVINGGFDMHKPGDPTDAATWATGTYGPMPTVAGGISTLTNGTVDYSKGGSGTEVVIPGWIHQSPGNITDFLEAPDGGVMINALAEWSGADGARIRSSSSLGTITAGRDYLLSAAVNAGDAGTRVLRLLANGVEVTPSSAIDPADDTGWGVISRTYDTADLVGFVGQDILVELGCDVPVYNSSAQFDDVTLNFVNTDPTYPDVDAGPDMITWTGQKVELDPNVVNNAATALTFAWTADDASAVFDPISADVEELDVTIIKPTTVMIAIAISNPGFEIPALADGDYTSDFTNCPGWDANDGGTGGVWDPGLGGTTFPGYGGSSPEGENVAYVTASGIEQILSTTVKADTTYTLTVKVGNSAGALSLWTGYTVQLLAGGNLVGEDDNSLTIASEAFETSTVTYSSGADAEADPNVGQPLQIRLLTNGTGEANFDDVKLTTVGPAPNPYIVTCTLAVLNEGRPVQDTVVDSMKIYVYEDACDAARNGKGLTAENLGDFNEDCITDANDLDELAENWLAGDALTAPVIQP